MVPNVYKYPVASDSCKPWRGDIVCANAPLQGWRPGTRRPAAKMTAKARPGRRRQDTRDAGLCQQRVRAQDAKAVLTRMPGRTESRRESWRFRRGLVGHGRASARRGESGHGGSADATRQDTRSQTPLGERDLRRGTTKQPPDDGLLSVVPARAATGGKWLPIPRPQRRKSGLALRRATRPVGRPSSALSALLPGSG